VAQPGRANRAVLEKLSGVILVTPIHLPVAATKDRAAVESCAMSNSRLLFWFDPSDWLYLASGVTLVTLFAAVFVL